MIWEEEKERGKLDFSDLLLYFFTVLGSHPPGKSRVGGERVETQKENSQWSSPEQI